MFVTQKLGSVDDVSKFKDKNFNYFLENEKFHKNYYFNA